MGDFTSKYKVNYSDGSSRVEERLDVGKAGSPIIILAFIVLALIAAIPALIHLPLYFYLRKPYKTLKPYVKADKSVLNYKSDPLKKAGYKNLEHLYSSTVLKFWGMMLVLLSAIVAIDIGVFSEMKGNDLGEMMLVSGLISLGVAAVTYPVGFLLMHSNRSATRIVLSESETTSDKVSHFTSKICSLKCAMLSFFAVFIAPILLLVAVSVSFTQWHKSERLAYEDVSEKILYYPGRGGESTPFAVLKDTFLEEGIDLNEPYASMPLMYDLMGVFYEWNEPETGFFEKLFRHTKKESAGIYIAEELYSRYDYFRYQGKTKNDYPTNYANMEKTLLKYQALGGSFSIVNPNTGKNIVAATSSIEAYDFLKKQGISFKGYEQEVMDQTFDQLCENTIYPKRLAKMTLNIGLTPTQAEALLNDHRYCFKNYGYAQTIKALESIINTPSKKL